MIKKMGVVTVGVAAGLLAAAPFASATECHHDSHGSHGSHGSHRASSDNDCNVTGGEATANGGISGDSLANGLVQAPVGGSNLLNLTCNKILNDNLSGNHLSLDLL